jgi:cytochrome P450
LIPKGTLLLANVWAINRDPDTYGPDAAEFRPDRYIDEDTGKLKDAQANMREDGHVSFGFGRRVCPGRSLGNKMIFISLAMMLWALDMRREQAPDNEPVPLDIDGCIDEGIVV